MIKAGPATTFANGMCPRVSFACVQKGGKVQKKKTLKFTLDCTQPVTDGVLETASFVSCVASNWRGRFSCHLLAHWPLPRCHCMHHATMSDWAWCVASPPQQKFKQDHIKVNGKLGKLGSAGASAVSRPAPIHDYHLISAAIHVCVCRYHC